MFKNRKALKDKLYTTIKMKIAYILIKTRHGKLKVVSSQLKGYEEVEEIHETFGRYDIIAKVTVEDENEMKQFIQNKFLITEGIDSSETLIVFS